MFSGRNITFAMAFLCSFVLVFPMQSIMADPVAQSETAAPDVVGPTIGADVTISEGELGELTAASIPDDCSDMAQVGAANEDVSNLEAVFFYTTVIAVAIVIISGLH